MGREPEKAGRVIEHNASLTWSEGKKEIGWVPQRLRRLGKSLGSPQAEVSVRKIPCLQGWVCLRSHGSSLWVA